MIQAIYITPEKRIVKKFKKKKVVEFITYETFKLYLGLFM